MTVRIVDRRFDSKNKSSVNRARFIKRFKGQIRKAVSDAIGQRGVRDLCLKLQKLARELSALLIKKCNEKYTFEQCAMQGE